ncbi:MAG: proteasome accessory factor PafA2 family protein [Nitrospira sp.]|nr:proteasome accessory factor PafA2 family protein [Nitrospira sp.]
MRLFGIETEYGITREDLSLVDPVVESMELVRAHLTASFERRWDYAGEDPHQDARGFRVATLAQDEEEEEFSKAEASRPFSFHEVKSDLVLPNGARFYNDHTHPEYSTPECRTLKDLVAHDKAGERIVQQAADRRNRMLGGTPVQVYKNNTDFHGHSYGCHDNYLVPRSVPFAKLVSGLLPFLVSRQVIAGAGKVGIESQEAGWAPAGYQLSQRADFMETELSVDTMHNRPILNTRDEPHADPTKYRRLHLIIGDANLCEYATALKVGTTALVLELIERGDVPDLELECPVEAVKRLSRDSELKTTVRLRNGKAVTALEIQEQYYRAAERTLNGCDAETDWIVKEWGESLRWLAEDRRRLVGKLDWITKLWLLETFMEEERLQWNDPWLASLDLEYHNVNPERGLYRGLEAEGKVWRMTTDFDIEQALSVGPSDTRGGVRGVCVSRFSSWIKTMQWGRIQFAKGAASGVLEMGDLFDPSVVARCRALFQAATSPLDALQEWNGRQEGRS